MPNDQRRAEMFLLGGGSAQPPQLSYGGGSNITQMLLEQGRQQADAARAQGQVWSGAFQQATQQLAGGFQQAAAEKKLKKRDEAWLALINDPEVMKDPKAAYAGTVKVWGPGEADQHFQALVGAHQIGQPKRNPEADLKALGVISASYLKAGPAGRALQYPTLRALAVRSDPVYDQHLPQQHSLEADTGLIAPFAEQFAPEKKPGSFDTVPTAEGIKSFNKQTGEAGAVIGQPPAPKPEKGPAGGSFEDYLAKTAGPSATPQQILSARKAYNQSDDRPRITITGPPVDTNDPAVDVAAKRYNATGVLPPRAAGSNFVQATMRRAAQLDPNADIAGSAADYRANTGSQVGLQKSADAVAAFEKTATLNSSILEDTLKKLPDAGASFLNRPLRAMEGHLGSEDMAAFSTARQSVANEYSRILQNSPGVLSDSARKEGSVLLDPNATVGQIRSALRVLKAEATNRNRSYQEQLGEIRGRRGGSGRSGAPSAPGGPSGRPRVTNPQTGEVLEYDGKAWVKP